MKTMTIKAAAAMLLVASTTTGAAFSERDHLRIAAAWAQLSENQREMIELVAKDIWDRGRDGRKLGYHELSRRQKNALRAKAMKQLGFEPRRVTGYEV